jgi:hypothetical protein
VWFDLDHPILVDIGLREVVSLVEQRDAVGFRAGVRQAIRKVQLCGMATSFSVLCKRRHRFAGNGIGDRNNADLSLLNKAAKGGIGCFWRNVEQAVFRAIDGVGKPAMIGLAREWRRKPTDR